MTQALTTPEVDIDRIEIQDDYNARTHFDPDELQAMADSIADVGVVEPIPVYIREEDGVCEVLAGERRYRAAKLAGLRKVPIAPKPTRDRGIAYAENHHRVDLDPIATARDLKALAEERELRTNKEIAAAAKETPQFVGLHLRLLKLPQEVQEAIAAGAVPAESERLLRPVAKVSPAVAAWVCEWARRNEIGHKQFVDDFRELFTAAGMSREPGKPTMIRPWGVRLSDVVADADKRKELVERIAALARRIEENPVVNFSQEDVDAARAAGCLVEVKATRDGFTSTSSFITDAPLAADLVERQIEEMEAEEKRRAAAAAKLAPQGAGKGSAADGPAKESPQAKAKKLKTKAIDFNERLWGKVLGARSPGRRKQAALQRAKAAMLVMIASNRDLAGAGLRLVWPQLREVEHRPLKNGKKRTTITYADRDTCNAELIRRVLGAKSVEELHEIVAEALTTAILAKPEAIAQAGRIHWSIPLSVEKEVKKLLGADLKALRAKATG